MPLPTAPVNTVVLGDTRSGKTSATARQLLTRWLRPTPAPVAGRRLRFWKRPAAPTPAKPAGLLALCVKPSDAANYQATLALADRAADSVVVAPGGPWMCDPLAAYFALPGSSPAGAAKLVGTLATLADRNDGKGGDPFWQQAGETLNYYALVALASVGKPKFGELYAFLRSMPFGNEDIAAGTFQSGFAGRVMARAVANPSPKHASAMPAVIEYVTRTWPSMPDKMRESVRQVALSAAFPFSVPPVSELCAGDTLTPHLADAGKCIILDVPVLRFGTPGLLWQSAFRMVTDLTMLDRDPTTASNVIVLMDEFQWLALPDWDLKVATVCSESKYFGVRLAQTLPVLYAALGTAQQAEHQVAGLLANAPLKVGHYTGCPVTQKYFSELVGQSKQFLLGGSVSNDGYDLVADLAGTRRPAAGLSFHEQWHPKFRPERMTTFRRGGPDNEWTTDALVAVAGREPAVEAIPQLIL